MLPNFTKIGPVKHVNTHEMNDLFALKEEMTN